VKVRPVALWRYPHSCRNASSFFCLGETFQLVASLDIKETMKEKPGFTRTNWEKVDKDEYQQILKAKLEKNQLCD
jgi:hypothetical protein